MTSAECASRGCMPSVAYLLMLPGGVMYLLKVNRTQS